MVDLENKVCIVTGSTSGIGKVTALELAKKGAQTIIVARDQSRGEQTLAELKKQSRSNNIDLFLCDFSSQKSIHSFIDAFLSKYDHLDILVNNAGLMCNQRIESDEGIELTFAVNHLGYFLTTLRLLDLMRSSKGPSRIIVVASDAHFNSRLNINELMHNENYYGFGVYSDTKLANILFTYSLAERLRGSNITVNTLHPGVIKTKFSVEDRNSNGTFPMGVISPEKGAETQLYLCTSDDVSDISGKYFVNKRAEHSSALSYDKSLAEKLWQCSVDLTGIDC